MRKPVMSANFFLSPARFPRGLLASGAPPPVAVSLLGFSSKAGLFATGETFIVAPQPSRQVANVE